MQLNMGLGGSVFAQGGYPSAAVPAAAGATPQGPTTIGQKAFGVVAGDEGGRPLGTITASLGTLALIGLVFIWWSLPR